MREKLIAFKNLLSRLRPRPGITDDTFSELGLVAFFCMFGAGLWLYSPAVSLTVCGLLGMMFFYPRGTQ